MRSPVLSDVLSDTLVGIYRFHLQYGVMPSVRDLKAVLQKSHGAVQNRRDKLEALGYIAWLTGKSRSITITDKGMAHLRSIGVDLPSEKSILAINRLPLLGEIAAGYLSEPATHDAFVEVETFDAAHHFTLTVSGDSMIGVGIIDRATAVFKRVPDGYEPKPGQIVAAYVEGAGTTLKRFYRNGMNVILEAANPNYPNQEIDTRQAFVRIDGVWTGVTIAAGV